MTKEEAIEEIRYYCQDSEEIIKALEQQPKIKVLDRDEAIRKLAAVDVYPASAWATLLKDLELLELKICEVEDGKID